MSLQSARQHMPMLPMVVTRDPVSNESCFSFFFYDSDDTAPRLLAAK
jgi:hypothetical protein